MNVKELRSGPVFSATVLVYEDGTLAIIDSDIRGFFIQVNNLHELLVESQWVASELLNLTDECSSDEIAENILEFKFEFVVKDEPHLETISMDLSLPIILGKEKIGQSLQLA